MKFPILPDSNFQLTRRIKDGDIQAFEDIFNAYYSSLVNFSRNLLKDDSLAEDQVQEVFAQVWKKRETLNEQLPLFPYLLTAVRNKCLNILNHRLVQKNYLSQTQYENQRQLLSYDYNDLTEESIERMGVALNQLPEKCRAIFELSKFEGLSHKEIAAKLNISTKTIENHITKAFRVLKNEMLSKAHFLVLWLGETFI